MTKRSVSGSQIVEVLRPLMEAPELNSLSGLRSMAFTSPMQSTIVYTEWRGRGW